MTGDVAAPPRVNVLDPAFYVDPWDAYRWLRDEAPVFWDPVQRLWAISRYDDVLAVERDGARYSSFSGSRPHIDQRDDESMINMDDPEHQAQRNLVVAPVHASAVCGATRTTCARSSTDDPRRRSCRSASARRSRPSPPACRRS